MKSQWKLHSASLALVWFCLARSFAQTEPANVPPAPVVPVVKAGSGPCTADFLVRDASGKGVYDARITMHVEWGFLGLRKLDLSTNTNSQGQARIEGLPDKPRKPAEFKVAYAGETKTVPYDPFAHCAARNELTFGEPSANTAGH